VFEGVLHRFDAPLQLRNARQVLIFPQVCLSWDAAAMIEDTRCR
jgi:hypothetical protein